MYLTEAQLGVRRRMASVLISCAITLPGVAAATDLSGCWSGSWQSCVTSHQGTLNAEFVRLDDCRYEVFFQGRFFKILPFRYSVVMMATEQDGVVYLSGYKYLGRMFGAFSFSAAATDCEFNADYSSCKDHGRFTMSRCTRAVPCGCD